MKRALFLAVASFFLIGCHRPSLTCRSEYLYPPYLASTQVNTPDPQQACFLGQQVIVSWDLPPNCLNRPLTLLFHIRYGTREMETISLPIEKRQGWWIYRLMNQDYVRRCGILSFQAEIAQEGVVIAEWNHYLWKEIIEISQN